MNGLTVATVILQDVLSEGRPLPPQYEESRRELQEDLTRAVAWLDAADVMNKPS